MLPILGQKCRARSPPVVSLLPKARLVFCTACCGPLCVMLLTKVVLPADLEVTLSQRRSVLCRYPHLSLYAAPALLHFKKMSSVEKKASLLRRRAISQK